MSYQVPKHKRLDFVDVARGLAALLVLLEHTLHLCFPGYAAFSLSNIVIGQAAILVFFAVSGFVIPLSLEEGRSVSVFWVRRFFRLFPVYWFSIALGFAYLRFGGRLPLSVGLADTKSWLANIFLLQKVLSRPNVWDCFWSLHYEIAVYILGSTLFAVGLLRRFGTRWLYASLAGLTLAFTAVILFSRTAPGAGDLRLVILAALLGFAANRYLAGRIGRQAFYGLLGGMFAALLVLWGASRLRFPEAAPLGQLLRWLAIAIPGFGGFVALLEARARAMPRAACWLGRRSYPIYLVHPFILFVLADLACPRWLLLPSAMALSLLLGDLTHRFIEGPGIAVGRLLQKRRQRVEEPLPVSAAA